MEKTKEIVEVLQKVLNDKNFITSLMKDTEKYNIRDIEKKLGTVLSYYISTRDTQTDYTYEEIQSKYEEIQGLPLDPDTEVYKNTITHGFFTHSFNGYKKDRIMKYGLNYMGMIDDKDTLTEIQEARDMLQQLESILGKSQYLKPLRNHEHSSEEVFITTPGVKTIYYTCQNSPERLYLGPLAQERGKEEPIVVGENKQTYMLRVLTKKIQKKYPDTNSTEYKDAMKLCRDITEYYCSKPPSFALIDIEKVKKMPVFLSVYREDKAMGVEDWIKAQREVYMSIFYIGGFFSTETGMTMERNNLGDLVTLSKYIPDGAISGIVDMIDGFDMQQLFARTKGRKIGDLIDYNTCEYRGEPSIEQLLAAITPNATEEELQEIRAKYEKIRQTQKQEGITTQDTLSDILTEFEQKGLMTELLKKDTEIERDELQFQSETHGKKHTRRVNFFAMAIMNMENITGRDRDIIYEIVKNHDIGREHDWEDREHGENSIAKIEEQESRLADFSLEEQAIIKFVIAQHSRSAKENQQAISELPEELRQHYSLILDVFKDADKLDRVRLDPKGEYPKEGLDSSRLSLESSKKLEGVAYEAYNKLLEILDIEKQNQEESLDSMQVQKNIFLQSIIEQSKKKIGLNEINNFVRNIKTEIMKFFQRNQNEQQNER